MNGQQESSLVQNLYYYIQERVSTDWTTDPVLAVVLSIVTCGIYGFYVFYKLMERRDLHLARVANMVNTTIAILREKSESRGMADAVAQEMGQLEMVQREIYGQSRERSAVLWLVLGILTGICVLIGYYFIMEDLAKHDQLEAQFFTLTSGVMAKLGMSSQASQAAVTIPERNFPVFLVLTIVTCGIYGFYWLYVMVNDGNIHVESQVQWEDFIYSALSTA